jgi:membrane protease YdiL (CAAX protease family)
MSVSRREINQKYGLHLAALESMFCLLEFVFGLVTSSQLCTYVVEYLGLPADSQVVKSVAMLASNALVVAWMSYRMANSLSLSTKEYLARLVASPSLSRTGAALLALHSVGFAMMVGAQYYTGRWIFSIDNYLMDDGSGGFSLSQALEMLAFSPFREEIVFRAAMFCIFYRRTGDGKGRSSQMQCIVACSCVFGAIHMLNLVSKKFSTVYIVMQVSLGFLIGMTYSFRFVLNSSIREGVILHIMNNLFSSFLPVEMHISLSDPLILLPLLQTIVVYSLINYRLYNTLMSTKSQFSILAPARGMFVPIADAVDGEGDGESKKSS